MPISRPMLIALAGVVLIGAVFMLTRMGADGADGAEPTTAPAASVAEEPTAPPEGAPSADADPPARDAEGPRAVPRRVEKALAAGRVAVIVLYQPGAADDEATLAAVRRLEQARDGRGPLRRKVEIFTDGLGNAAEYVGLTAALGVSQAPAVAIVRPNGEARVLEGYQDRSSLRQHLADAL